MDNNLYKILKRNRHQLPEFLKQNCSYDFLKTQLIAIEEKYSKDKNNDGSVIKDLLLGNIGEENNKQKAIYELPTNELLQIIKYICEYLQITQIEEIASGMGLLSHMLNYVLGNNYKIDATDGIRWAETSCEQKYYDVKTKLFLNYCIDNNYYLTDKLVIMSWIPQNEFVDLLQLIEVKKPKYLMIIDDKFSKTYNKLCSRLDFLNYKKVGIPVKQISYKDYWFNNTYLPETSCVCTSTLLFATRDDINMDTMLLNIKLKLNNCLAFNNSCISDKFIIQDIIHNNYNKKFLINALENELMIDKIALSIKFLLKKNIKIPDYLESVQEYTFWFNKIKNNHYPLNITNRQKFKEYKKYIELIDNSISETQIQNNLNTLRQSGILTQWVFNIIIAKKFIWLEYSTTIKTWKASYNNFITEFNTIRNNINAYV